MCAPSRSVLMTGQHTGHTPVRGNQKRALPDSSVTVAEILKQAGYTTGVFGKWSLGLLHDEGPDEGYPTRQGFDEFFGYDNQTLQHRQYPKDLKHNESVVTLTGNDGVHKGVYAPEMIQGRLMQFIEKNKKQPFFLYYATTLAHAELIVHDESLLNKFKGRFEETPYKGNDYGASDFKWSGYCSQEYPNANYVAMVTLLDIYVGQIINKLDDAGLMDNTIIFFASDNGAASSGGRDPVYFNSAANLRGLKGSFFEGGIRAPFMVYWKGMVAAGSESNLISSFQDVLPTLAEIVHKKVPEEIDGISFLPTLLGKPQKNKHDYLYWENGQNNGKQAVRKNKWKAVRNNVSKDPDSPIMLFDLDKDPFESTDISDEHPGIVNEMKVLLRSARTEHPFYKLFPDE